MLFNCDRVAEPVSPLVGELVELGAYHADHGYAYVTCTLNTTGAAQFLVDGSGPRCGGTAEPK